MINHDQEKRLIQVLRLLALISIICAHVAEIPDYSNTINQVFSLALDSIGTIGVGIFLLISGYLFSMNKYSLNVFIVKKIRNIIIPWFFLGTIDFLYVALRKGGLTLANWILTLTVNSHMYYLTVLILLYILFWKIKDNINMIIFMIFLSIVSISLTSFGYLTINPYINPFNWAIYFTIGLLIRKYQVLSIIVQVCQRFSIFFLIAYLSIFSFFIFNGISIRYWMKGGIILELLAITVNIGIASYLLNTTIIDQVYSFSDKSYAIYLLHMPFAGIISNIFSRFNSWYLTPFRPLIVLLLTALTIFLIQGIGNKIGISKYIDLLFGFRKKRIY